MTENVIPFETISELRDDMIKDMYDEPQGDWSVRRVAKECLDGRLDFKISVMSAVAGAYAVASVDSLESGQFLFMNDSRDNPVHLVNDLAKEMLEDDDLELDEMTSRFSALGCFAWEFIQRKCTAEDINVRS